MSEVPRFRIIGAMTASKADDGNVVRYRTIEIF